MIVVWNTNKIHFTLVNIFAHQHFKTRWQLLLLLVWHLYTLTVAYYSMGAARQRIVLLIVRCKLRDSIWCSWNVILIPDIYFPGVFKSTLSCQWVAFEIQHELFKLLTFFLLNHFHLNLFPPNRQGYIFHQTPTWIHKYYLQALFLSTKICFHRSFIHCCSPHSFSMVISSLK